MKGMMMCRIDSKKTRSKEMKTAGYSCDRSRPMKGMLGMVP